LESALRLVEDKLLVVNKLIFVKQYEKADDLLAEIVASPEGEGNLIAHLRRMELASKIGGIHNLHKQYTEQMKVAKNPTVARLCMIMCEQIGEMAPHPSIIQFYQEYIKEFGPSAAAFHGIGFSLEQLGNLDRAAYNYEQSLSIDNSWFPSYFGLSQLNYLKGDDKQGDHFFFLFEEIAPYNVYGNFETHRKLHLEFLDKGDFEAAEVAITTLSEWWFDNRGTCPAEIQVFESYALAKIADVSGDKSNFSIRMAQGRAHVSSILQAPSVKESALMFVAKTLEEYGDNALALDVYKKVLRTTSGNPTIVQKIGTHFLSIGEYALAKDLFWDAYQANPDHVDIRFCLLVSRLRVAGVNAEEYLRGREKLRGLLQNPNDRVEQLALLHTLMNMFKEDSDVHLHLGDLYNHLGNTDRAARHFQEMFRLDPHGKHAIMKYATYLVRNNRAAEGLEILEKAPNRSRFSAEELGEIDWLRAHHFHVKGEYKDSQALVERVLRLDPWNSSYLVLAAANLSNIHRERLDEAELDRGLAALLDSNENEVDWRDYDRQSKKVEQLSLYQLAYVRRKIRFLYSNQDEKSLVRLVMTSCRFDAETAFGELLKLVNTNFDSPMIYWGLGVMQKELWQLETAATWFELMLRHVSVTDALKARSYIEIADTYVWRGKKLDRAIEYAKLAIDLGEQPKGRVVTVLTHAYLKSGLIREAQTYLEQAGTEQDAEFVYLRGLLAYRNGQRQRANELWKPLLTVKSESLRFHQIKQDIMRYYYDGAPYLKAN